MTSPEMIPQESTESMFSASAELYDLIYSGFKDYPAEAASIAALIRRHSPDARCILDVACGTGEHARLLAAEHGFEVDGLDLEPGFVRIAQAKLAGGTVHLGDMTSFALPRRYDVVMCLFSAIGYVRTLARVRSTLERFRAHLGAGGIVLVEPWFPPGALDPGQIFAKTASADDVTVCRMSHTEIEGAVSRLRFEYLIGRSGGVERASEVHELGLFTVAELEDCFRAVELAVSYDPVGLSGRGLYVGRVSTDDSQDREGAYRQERGRT